MLLLWAVAPKRPREAYAGTFKLWTQVASPAEGRGGARRPPLRIWLAAMGAVAAILALARPIWRAKLGPEVWTVVVDTSPSMGLPCLKSPGPEETNVPTRLQVAVMGLDRWLEERRAVGARPITLRWLASNRTGWEARDPSRVEALAVETSQRNPSPEWARFDRVQTLWLSDSAPEPMRALAFNSGGAAVYGPVMVAPEGLMVWRGTEALELLEGPPGMAREVRLAPGLPEVVDAFVRTWADERRVPIGVSQQPRPDDSGAGTQSQGAVTALEVRHIGRPLELPGGTAARPRVDRVGRDGWGARGCA